MPESDPQSQLTLRILVGMVVGLALGLTLNFAGVDGWIDELLVNGLLHVGGEWRHAVVHVMAIQIHAGFQP